MKHRPGRTYIIPLIVLAIIGIAVIVVGMSDVWKPRDTIVAAPAPTSGWIKPQKSNDSQIFVRQPQTLAPGVFMLGRMSPSTVYAIQTSAGIVLVDTGMQADASSLVEQMKELSLNASQICAILLTHVHGDHSLGAKKLRELTGAKIYAGQGDSQVLRAGSPREAFFSTFELDQYDVHKTEVDVELKGDEVLEFGDIRITVIGTPGHTPGSLCYLLDRDDVRVLFAGDTLTSLVGDLGTYTAYLPPRYRGDARAYLESLRKLREMPVPDLVLPGHPFDPDVPSRPSLREADWQKLLDRGIREMERLVTRYVEDGEDFLDGEAKELLPGLHYLGDQEGYPVFVLINASHQFLFDAPGADDFAEFVAQRLQSIGIDSPDVKAVLLTSADPDAIRGLASVTERWPCEIVAPTEKHDRVRELCPELKEVISPNDVASRDWFPVQVIELQTPEQALAYLIPWEGKSVLVSGKTPITITDSNVLQLANALKLSPDGSWSYERSVRLLGEIHPNLWLTTKPKYGQNANVYGTEWMDVIKANLDLVRDLKSKSSLSSP